MGYDTSIYLYDISKFIIHTVLKEVILCLVRPYTTNPSIFGIGN